MGKDLYQQFRKAIVKLAGKSKHIVDQRGSRNILIIRVEREVAYVDFVFAHPPAEHELTMAFASAEEVLASIPEGQFTSAQFDPNTQRWNVVMVPDAATASVLAEHYRPRK